MITVQYVISHLKTMTERIWDIKKIEIWYIHVMIVVTN